MKNFSRCPLLVSGFMLVSLGIVGLAPTQATVVALIPDHGEGAPSPVIQAQLLTILTDQAGISLVERDRVHDLLKEQQLSLSGVVDPDAVIEAGKMVGAELFVYLETIARTSKQ